MTITVLVDVPCEDWNAALGDCQALVIETVQAALAATPYATRHGDVEIGVTLTDDDAIRRLNHQHRGKDRPTNVLSFPLMTAPPEDPALPVLLGDIVVAWQTVAAEAAHAGRPVDQRLRHMLAHGALHLAGYDHMTEAEADEMEALEARILWQFGIANPYLCDESCCLDHDRRS